MRLQGVEALAASFAPGERIYLPGSGGESAAFTAALTADPALTAGLELVTSFVPGINPLPIDAMAPDVRVKALFLQAGTEAAQRDGRLRALPVTYAGFVHDLVERWSFDAAVVHVAPPDAQGRCSLGVAGEFTMLAAARSTRLLAVVNPRMPVLENSPWLPADGFEAACEAEGPLRTYDPGAPDAAALRIAEIVAAEIPDGAVVQLGIGKAPSALAARLRGHRRLRFWSGLISDGFLGLAAAGALEDGATHLCCAAVGTDAFHAALLDHPQVRVAGCDVTHDAEHLARQSPLYAVNSALEVDLWGQCNLEQAAGRMVSGAGGAPDFARAASRGAGLSIVALPSTAGRDARSRIVPRLEGGLVSLARHEVDMVATEHGAADLRGLDTDARARALIAVAAPQARDPLARAWREGPTPRQGATP